MKNRSLSIFVAIGIICLCGLFFFMLFRVSRSQNQVPLRTVKVDPRLNQKTAKDKSGRALYKSVTPPKVPNTDTSDTTQRKMDTAEEQRLLTRFFEIEKSSEYQDFVNTKTQERVEMYHQEGVFNFSFQEFFDFFESQGMPRVDFAQEALEVFREYFPSGDPKDYETEMVARFQEAFWAVPGSRTQASTTAFTTLSEEPDFSAWMLGRFKGELAPQLQWIETQAITAMEILEDASFHADFIAPALVSPVTENASDISSTSTETVRSPSRQGIPLSNVETPASVEMSSFSRERVASVRQVLQEYGTDTGILHLIEIDPESVDWIFENFRTLDEIDAWISPPKAPTPPQATQKKRHSKPPISTIQEFSP
ncbi:MAG: hypothetical protein OXG97_20325 [Candidatus Poribacteria bacterium]|nr:hypothetical protein [Candidatus Poribacteria bacterium]